MHDVLLNVLDHRCSYVYYRSLNVICCGGTSSTSLSRNISLLILIFSLISVSQQKLRAIHIQIYCGSSSKKIARAKAALMFLAINLQQGLISSLQLQLLFLFLFLVPATERSCTKDNLSYYLYSTCRSDYITVEYLNKPPSQISSPPSFCSLMKDLTNKMSIEGSNAWTTVSSNIGTCIHVTQ